MGLSLVVIQAAPALVEYWTLVTAEPFELPSVYPNCRVRLVDVIALAIVGAEGILGLVTAAVDACAELVGTIRAFAGTAKPHKEIATEDTMSNGSK